MLLLLVRSECFQWMPHPSIQTDPLYIIWMHWQVFFSIQYLMRQLDNKISALFSGPSMKYLRYYSPNYDVCVCGCFCAELTIGKLMLFDVHNKLKSFEFHIRFTMFLSEKKFRLVFRTNGNFNISIEDTNQLIQCVCLGGRETRRTIIWRQYSFRVH